LYQIKTNDNKKTIGPATNPIKSADGSPAYVFGSERKFLASQAIRTNKKMGKDLTCVIG